MRKLLEDANRRPEFRCDRVMHVSREDSRYESFAESKEKRGFSPSECWTLDYSAACFLLPRLEHFLDNHGGHPVCLEEDEWRSVLLSIGYSLQCVADDVSFSEESDLDGGLLAFHEAVVQEGFNLLGEYFQGLWS